MVKYLFAQYMAKMPEGVHQINLRFMTDNPLQAGKVLAESSFHFEMSQHAQAHLRQVAETNLAQGPDPTDSPEQKIAAFERISQPSEKLTSVQLTLKNRGSGDIWVMIGYNSGQKYLVGYQQSIQVSAPTGENVYKYDGGQCTTNFGYIGKTQAEQILEVY